MIKLLSFVLSGFDPGSRQTDSMRHMHQPVLKPAQMAAADKKTIDSGVSGSELMERAGLACFKHAVELAGGALDKRFLVLCGPGNNGGDGFVVARHLRLAGAEVECLLIADPSEFKGDAALNLTAVQRVGVEPRIVKSRLLAGDDSDCIVDALFGTGFRGALEGSAAQVVADANHLAIDRNIPVLSVDIPSGVNGLTGEVLRGLAIRATSTVAIQALKCGHLLEPGAQYVGELVSVNIGIGIGESDTLFVDPVEAVGLLPERSTAAQKWSVGSVLVMGGSVGMSGAPTLVTKAAFRSGAGLVVVAVPAAVQPLVAANMIEAMTVPLAEQDGKVSPSGLSDIPDLDRFSSVALGPGLGRSHSVSEFVKKALVSVAQPMVLDADGLNAISGQDLLTRRGPTVITPHEGELKRLGCDVDELSEGLENRIDAVRQAANDWNVAVLLKGPTTIVAAPSKPAMLCRSGGPELATAGSGDTLTGMIAAYIARGLDPYTAAWVGATVHGQAGHMALTESGSHLIASDIINHIGPAEQALLA